MKYMKAAEFKAKCLKVMEDVAATGETLVVTKRGTPIVHVVAPPAPLPEYFGWGAGAHFYVPNDADLVSPVVDSAEWDCDESNLHGSHTPASDPRDSD